MKARDRDRREEASSQGQIGGGTTQAPVSAWHLHGQLSGRVPKLRQYLMLFYLILNFRCIFTLYYMHT